MKRIFTVGVLIVALGWLTACQTKSPNAPTIVTERRVVVDVPNELYNCPTLKKFPDYETLTEREVAQLITTLHKNNVTCKNSELAIKRYLSEIKRTTR
jgi:hypothetical protein